MTRTISKLANELGINIETIRFYERRGLIDQPKKPQTGYRHYSDEILARIRFVRRAQELGFTLEEVATLFILHNKPCKDVQSLAEQKLISVQEKIVDLNRLQHALAELVSQCRNNKNQADCPVIHSLQPDL